MFALRRERHEGPHLAWRIRLFFVAAVFGLAGIYFDEGWLTGFAILVLFAALGLRFAAPRASEESEDEADT